MTVSLLEKLVSDAENKHSDPVRDWDRRFTDPMVMFAWVSATSVIPANKDKGVMVGFRTFPDGSRETFFLT